MNNSEILEYALNNMSSFHSGGISSNEIRYFELMGKNIL